MNRGSSAPPPWGPTAWGLGAYGMGAKATSLAFQSLTFGQLLHAYSCRSESRGIFQQGERPPPNPYLDVAIGGSLALQVLTMVVPGLRRLLGVTSMNLFDVALVGGSAVLPLVINESRKEKKRKVDNER
jgi:Ca2+-transporting ATPase